jgi:hypothetical protein
MTQSRPENFQQAELRNVFLRTPYRRQSPIIIPHVLCNYLRSKSRDVTEDSHHFSKEDDDTIITRLPSENRIFARFRDTAPLPHNPPHILSA